MLKTISIGAGLLLCLGQALASGTPSATPLATATRAGSVKCDGATTTCATDGTISASGSGFTSGTPFTATGGSASLTAAQRAGFIVHIREYGAVCDGSSHPLSGYFSTLAAAQAVYPTATALTDEIDGVAINKTAAWIRSNRVTNGKVWAELAFDGSYCLSTVSVNFTGFSLSAAALGLTIEGNGAVLYSKAAGVAAVDMLGDRSSRLFNLTIVGDASSTPLEGLLLGRADATNNADDNYISGVKFDGSFSQGDVLNEASESTPWIGDIFINYYTGAYTLIQDGAHRFNASSQYVTNTNPTNSPNSFNENTFFSPKFINYGGGPAIYSEQTNRHSYYGAYANITGGPNAVVLSQASNTANTMLHMDMHVEFYGSTGFPEPTNPTYTFLLTGSAANQALVGFRFSDQKPYSTGSLFKLDSGVSTAKIYDGDLDLTNLQSGSTLFDNNSAWSIDANVYVPNSNVLNGFSNWMGGTLDVAGTRTVYSNLANFGQANGTAPLDALGRVAPVNSYIDSNSLHVLCKNWIIGYTQGNYSGASAFFETTRRTCPVINGVTQLRLFMPGKQALSGQEINAGGWVYHRAAIEYPLTTTNSAPALFALNGSTVMGVDPASSGAISDPYGVAMSGGTSFGIRYSTAIPRYPTVSAAVSTGGSLTSGTTYYYKVTCVYGSGESGPSTEASATPSSTNLSVTLTLTASANPLACQSWKIYRSTTTNTELYLAPLAAPGLVYVDNGGLGTTPGFSVPSANNYAYSQWLDGSSNTSSGPCGDGQGDLVLGHGTFNLAGPLNCYVTLPVLLGDDVTAPSVVANGDSIMAGQGIQGAETLVGHSPALANWFDGGTPEGSYNTLNASLPSSQACEFYGQNLVGVSQRLRVLNFGRNVISDLGTNDLLGGGLTWQQVATCHLNMGQALANRGINYWITTLLPRGTSTDNMLTVANFTQTGGTYETNRENYNTWIRNGMQVSAGAPVLTGGTPTIYIKGAFDVTANIETDSSGTTLTPNGGFWLTPQSAVLTTQPIASSTTSVITMNGTSYTAHAYAGRAAKIASAGGYNGENCVIQDNTATTLTCIVALGTAPSSSDTVSIWAPNSYDGTHPTQPGAAIIDAGTNGFTAWAAAHLKAA